MSAHIFKTSRDAVRSGGFAGVEMLQCTEHSREAEVDSGYRSGRALPDVGERRRTAVKVPLQAALLSKVLSQYLSFVTAPSVLLHGFINEGRN